MCLSYQSSFPLKEKDGFITAWKVIKKEDRSELFNYWWEKGVNETNPFWKPNVICDNTSAGYLSGFHCFVTREGARRWKAKGTYEDLKIIKVFIKPEHITAKGFQEFRKVVVASEVTVKSLKHQR